MEESGLKGTVVYLEWEPLRANFLFLLAIFICWKVNDDIEEVLVMI